MLRPFVLPLRCRDALAMSFFKFKKYVVSRMGDTKLGRAQLLEAVGEDVTALLEGLCDVVEKFADKSVAEDVNRKTIKLAAKVFLLWREKRVTVEDAAALSPLLVAAAASAVEALEGKPGAVDPNPAAAALQRAGEALVPIIQPHMKERNWQLVNELCGGMYASPAFLSFLFNSPLVVRERGVLLSQFHTLLAPFGGAGSKRRAQKCVIAGCELPRLIVRGAQYCQGHHALKYAAGPPARVQDFLENVEFAALFKEWLGEAHPSALRLLDLLHACRDFAEISNRANVKVRAPLLFDRFFREESAGTHYVALAEEVLAPVSAALGSGVGVTNRLYEPAVTAVLAHLDTLYHGDFRASSQYATWAAEILGYEVPPVPEARASLLASMGITVADVTARPGDASFAADSTRDAIDEPVSASAAGGRASASSASFASHGPSAAVASTAAASS